MTLEVGQLLSVFVVSLLWGITNPFISRGAKSSKTPDASASLFIRPFLEIFYFVTNWRFSIPFILNQSASVLFMVLVVNLPLTVTVVGVNSLTFLITAITGTMLGEAPLTKEMIVGSVFVMAGVWIISTTT